ncbi:hypothetical protein JO41_12135 [Treponema sp. OMZ 838]|nr:hypothetical protein JO41_12135 [Treponema sp. OMZ 838]
MITPVCSKKYAYKKLFAITLFCCFLPLILLYAETSTSDEADWSETEWDADELFIPVEQFAGNPVVDMAGILTLSEQQEIAARFTEFSESLKTDASVVLVPDTGDLTAEAYADDFFDYGGYGYGEDRDGILLLIVTGYGDGNGRKAHISTSGKRTINTVTDSRIDDLLDALIDGGAADGNYAAGINAYIDELHTIIQSPEQAAATKLKNSILFALGTGVFVFLISFLVLLKRYKIAGAKPYYNRAKQTQVHFASTDDPLISTNTISTVRPKNKSSESSTHTSSSGRSHGGGGRSF